MWTDVFMPISIIGSFGASLYFFTKVLTDYILRKKMIDKGYVGEDAQSIFRNPPVENRLGALKWGLLFLTGGIAFIVMHVLDVDPETPLPYGIFTVGLSIGFLIYYSIAKRNS